MNNLTILVFLGEKISSNISYIYERNESNLCYYEELVNGIIKDTYSRQRNGKEHPIVYELPTTPDKLINWLKEPLRNLVGGPFSSKDLLEELKEEPILLGGLEFNTALYELIEDFIDKKTIRKENHDTDIIKDVLLTSLWSEKSSFQSKLLYEDYVTFRRFLSKKENAITTLERLEQLPFKSYQSELFLRVLKELYESIPQGNYNYCEYCGWTLPKGSIGCVHRRCKSVNELHRANLQSIPKISLLRMKKGTVYSVLIPGFFELELAKKMMTNRTMFYEEPVLYPGIERNGDISIYNTFEGKTINLDCKDHQITGTLLKEVDKFTQVNPESSRIFVYPAKNTSLSKNRISMKNKQLKEEGFDIEILSDKEVIERLKKGEL